MSLRLSVQQHRLPQVTLNSKLSAPWQGKGRRVALSADSGVWGLEQE